MPFLVIAGITVPAVSASDEVVRIGTSGRAYAGNLRSFIRAEKREWKVETGLLTNAEATALKAAVALGAQVTCSGDALGGSVTCEVEIGQGGYISTAAADGTGVLRSLSLTIREV